MAKKVCLVRMKIGESERVHIVEDREFNFGRALEAVFSEADPSMSRNHLQVLVDGESIYVTDQGSANGTSLNGHKIDAKLPVLYRKNDVLTLGSDRVKVWFELVEKKQAKGASPEVETASAGSLDEIKKEIKGLKESAKKEIDEFKVKNREKIAREKAEAEQFAEKLIADAKAEVARLMASAKSMAASVPAADEDPFDQKTVVRPMGGIRSDSVTSAPISHPAAKESDAIIQAARRDAQEMVASAQREYDRLVNEARQEASKLVGKRKEELAKEADEKIQKLVSEAEAKSRLAVESAETKAKSILQNADAEAEAAKGRASEIVAQAQKEAELVRSQAQTIKTEAWGIVDEFRNRAQKTHDEIIEDANKQAASIIETGKQTLEDLKTGVINEGKIQAEDLIRKAEGKVAEFNLQIQALETQIKDFEAGRISAQAKFTEAHLELGKLETKMLDFKKIFDAEEGRVKQLQDSIAEENAKLDAKRQELQAVSEDIETVIKDKKDAIEYRNKAISEADDIKRVAEESKNNTIAEVIRMQALAKEEIADLRKREQDTLKQLRASELKSIEEMKNKGLMKIKESREHVVNEISHQLTLGLVNQFMDSKDKSWAEVSQNIKDTVRKIVDEEIFRAEQAVDKDAKNVAKTNPKLLKTIRWAAASLAAIVLVIAVVPTWRKTVLKGMEGVNEQGETAAQEYARKMREQRDSNKYNPPQTDDFKPTYTDNVLYTTNYVEIKLDQNFQERWIKDLNRLLVTELKMDEDLIVKVVATENTMINQLRDKKAEIHPDFVEDGIRKMRNIEMEMVARMKLLLKEPDKYTKFNEFAQRYYINEAARRMPAAAGK